VYLVLQMEQTVSPHKHACILNCVLPNIWLYAQTSILLLKETIILKCTCITRLCYANVSC